ncbi:MAG: LysE family translocator [Acinetobacter sp.]
MIEINWLLFFTYLISVIAIISTPGPNTLLMVQHAIAYGKTASFFNALGSATASLLLMIISILGIQAFLTEKILSILSIIGAIYLIYIGVTTMQNSQFLTVQDNESHPYINPLKFFKDAFLVGVSNPKDIIFFLVFMPQFIDKNISFFQSSLMLIVVWIICDVSIMMLYGVLSSKIRYLSSMKLGLISKISGALITLIGSGVLMNAIF